MHATILPPNVKDLSPLVMNGTVPRVMPAAFYAQASVMERQVLGALNAAYYFPTEEAVAWLRAFIGDRSALEIGSGNGAVAKALGIRGTDSHLQANAEMAAYYRRLGQAVVTYGPNVERIDAVAAVEKYKPDVVVAAWVTHKYDEQRHAAGGNVWGVDEEAIVKSCSTYVFIGNRQVHKPKAIWSLPHWSFEPPWLYSRAGNGTPEFIAVWGDIERAKSIPLWPQSA